MTVFGRSLELTHSVMVVLSAYPSSPKVVTSSICLFSRIVARRDGKLVFELRRSYDDPNAITIQEGDPNQDAMVWLLSNYQERPEIKIEKAFAQRLSHALMNREGPFPSLPKIQ